MTATTTKGLCGACFRAMALNADGTVKRHGWREAGGTRRVGQYGHVFHSGSCFGTGWQPYETSADCTKAFVERVLFPMAAASQNELARLDTRPVIRFEGRTNARYSSEVMASGLRIYYGRDARGNLADDRWDGYFLWVRLVRDGDPADCRVLCSDEDSVPSYDHLHSDLVRKETRRLDGITKDALFCLDKVSTWKPAEVATVAKPVKLVHLARAQHRYMPVCRMSFSVRGTSFHTTANAAEVTCQKCRAVLDRQAQRGA